MPNPDEIRRKAQGIQAVANDMDRDASKYKGDVSGIGSWWQGEGANAFKEGYSEIDSDIRRMLSKMGSLKERVNSLAGAVQRADNERAARLAEQRRAEEEARRMAAQKK